MEPQHDECGVPDLAPEPDHALLAWLDAHYRAMPPVAALQPRGARLHEDVLHLSAPLAANVNDKGCAFGGSLVSLMTLAGWGLVTLQLRRAGLEADVFVADTEVRYRAPLYADLDARAWLDEGQDWSAVAHSLRTTGRASAHLVARVALPEGGDAVRARARYVAIAKG
jgi:thioesterase domain-containing protein